MMRYKGTYRLKVPYDQRTNQFSRKLDGTLEDCDIYIDCKNGNQICYIGHSILQAYVPSLQRGHNILKKLKDNNNENIAFDIEETSEEVLFKFHSKYIEIVAELLKAKTSGANISPFSSRNLPKNKEFKIADKDLVAYKNITSKIPKKYILSITHTINLYLKSLTNKRLKWEDIKADMALKGLKGKEYIYSIGKWEDYIKYLQENIKEGV